MATKIVTNTEYVNQRQHLRFLRRLSLRMYSKAGDVFIGNVTSVYVCRNLGRLFELLLDLFAPFDLLGITILKLLCLRTESLRSKWADERFSKSPLEVLGRLLGVSRMDESALLLLLLYMAAACLLGVRFEFDLVSVTSSKFCCLSVKCLVSSMSRCPVAMR